MARLHLKRLCKSGTPSLPENLALGSPVPHARRTISQLLVDQVECANLIVLNKVDLVKPAELAQLEALLKKLNPKAKIIRSTYGKVDASKLLNTGSFDMAEAERMPGWFQELQGNHVPESLEYGISSIVYRAQKPFHPWRLDRVLSAGFPDVIRSKGDLAEYPEVTPAWQVFHNWLSEACPQALPLPPSTGQTSNLNSLPLSALLPGQVLYGLRAWTISPLSGTKQARPWPSRTARLGSRAPWIHRSGLQILRKSTGRHRTETLGRMCYFQAYAFALPQLLNSPDHSCLHLFSFYLRSPKAPKAPVGSRSEP